MRTAPPSLRPVAIPTRWLSLDRVHHTLRVFCFQEVSFEHRDSTTLSFLITLFPCSLAASVFCLSVRTYTYNVDLVIYILFDHMHHIHS